MAGLPADRKNVSMSELKTNYNTVFDPDITFSDGLNGFRGATLDNGTSIPNTGPIDFDMFRGRTFSAPTLYSFTSHTFTHCEISGIGSFSTGPSLSDCITEYGNFSPWADTTLFSVTGTSANSNLGIQKWTIPETATYTIEAFGASGGRSTSAPTVSDFGRKKGARVKADWSLNKGDVLFIIVGQTGGNAVKMGGGGGGTYVIKAEGPAATASFNSDSNIVLVVAGGGGGAGLDGYSTQGRGMAHLIGEYPHTVTPTAGQGGYQTTFGGGGGGLYGMGIPVVVNNVIPNYNFSGGHSYMNGSRGGNRGWSGSAAGTIGGFGGGGGGAYAPGGGGGYTGGGAGKLAGGYGYTGGGGGSFPDPNDTSTHQGRYLNNTQVTGTTAATNIDWWFGDGTPGSGTSGNSNLAEWPSNYHGQVTITKL